MCLSQIHLVTLFMDAIYLRVRPSGAKEGVLCAWGVGKGGQRVLLSVCLGMRESEQDWLALGCDLTARGLRSPLLVVSDGALGWSTPSSSYGRRPTASAARCIGCATCSPS